MTPQASASVSLESARMRLADLGAAYEVAHEVEETATLMSYELPQVVQFLRGGGTLADLEAKYAITARRHGEFPNLVMLKYAQIGSPMHEPIVQDCRGIILDEADDWRVISYPYRKFFNYGEPNAVALDWSTATVYEKLDGSLMTLYHYRGAWRVASSGTPDASGPAHTSGMTFAELFWKTFNALDYPLPVVTHVCFMFELMTPFNRVIVPHAKSRLVLHGARDLFNLVEKDPEVVAGWYGMECAKSHPLGCVDDCVTAAAVLNPVESEGYVVADAAFNRLKIKSPAYVALAHLKDGCSPRRLLDIARANESDEFLAHFPEWRAAYDMVRARYETLCGKLEMVYGEIKDIPTQKDFAMAAKVCECSAPLFSIRAGKVKTVKDFFAGSSLVALERAIGFDQLVEDVNAVVGQASGQSALTPAR